VTAGNRFTVISAANRRRLVAALFYFHVACRVKREGKIPGEFLAEALLNFHKVLEVLYGPDRVTVRTSLKDLGYTSDEIERDYIPSMLLRDQMDVGHPMLAVLTPRQLDTLHRYADRAERVFRDLLQRLFQAIEAGSFDVPAHGAHQVDPAVNRTLEMLRRNFSQLPDSP
jgi:hypothetical protein